MKKAAIVTATRAEYGLLLPLIRKLRVRENENFRVELIVTGTHLENAYGETIREIEADSVRIDRIIKIPVNSDTAEDISFNQAEALVKFSKLFAGEKYSAVILLGDRYETLSAAVAAGNTHTPVFHLCGGDTTEGAIDEWIRHSITKISFLHFVTNEDSRRRVIQLGETPDRVFNYGSTSIDNILSLAIMSKEDALESIGLSDCRYVLCTYHPVTMEDGTVQEQIESFVSAVRNCPDLEFIVTKSNADQGGAFINRFLDRAAEEIPNLHVYSSLGVKRYLSLMKYAECVAGNSSSGIIETPAFRVPTVNIGDRQRGRLQSESIINCKTGTDEIIGAIRKALSPEHKLTCASVVSPYGDGNAAEKIAQKIYEVILKDQIDLKKKFYDLDFQPPT